MHLIPIIKCKVEGRVHAIFKAPAWLPLLTQVSFSLSSYPPFSFLFSLILLVLGCLIFFYIRFLLRLGFQTVNKKIK